MQCMIIVIVMMKNALMCALNDGNIDVVAELVTKKKKHGKAGTTKILVQMFGYERGDLKK